MLLTHAERRVRLGDARLMLLFSPHLASASGDPLEALEAALPEIDIVQVRVKPPGARVSPARESLEWTRRVMEVTGDRALVLVNDRVDVASVIGPELDGVHLGDGDLAPGRAREILGDESLIGLSTHRARDVAKAQDEPVDYIGFGPIFPTATKGYEHGLGPEAAWIASAASAIPLFAIGGIDPSAAAELLPVGRVAVSSAILSAPDPAAAARAIRSELTG